MMFSSILLKVVLTWYGCLSILLFVLYGLDKAQAVINGRRIPEVVLHITALVGGFPGGLLGRTFFRHKTRKPVFLLILLISAAVHCGYWLLFLFI